MIITTDSEKDREVMRVMRKVLTAVIRDTTPPPGMRHPLTDETILDVKMCLGLITAREREMDEAAGVPESKPYYRDAAPTSTVVPFDFEQPEKGDKEK